MLISLNVCTGPWEAGAQLQEQNTENITKPHKNNPHTFTVRTKFLQNKAFSLFPLHHLCFISVLTVPPATLCLLHNLTNCTPERVTLYISSSTFRLLSKLPNAEEKKALQMLWHRAWICCKPSDADNSKRLSNALAVLSQPANLTRGDEKKHMNTCILSWCGTLRLH